MTRRSEESERRGEQSELEAHRAAEAWIAQTSDYSGAQGPVELPAERRRETDVAQLGGDEAAAEQKLRDTVALTEQLEAARANTLDIAELSASAQQELTRQLRDVEAHHAEHPDSPKARGDHGEAIARAAIGDRGLPTERGWRKVEAVVDGKYDAVHGIDLVAVMDGRPVIIEVKNQQRPVLSEYCLKEFGHDASQDSFLEMGDDWTRTRWRQLLGDSTKRAELMRAGVKSEYLSRARLEDTSLPQWADILSSKRIVVLSDSESAGVNRTLVRQAQERMIAPGHILTIEV